jgi:hypothetical protein
MEIKKQFQFKIGWNSNQKAALGIVIILFLVFGMSGCSKKYLNGIIYVGTGGGFAGTWKEYQLNINGDLYFKESKKDSSVYLKTLDSVATRKVFRKYYKLKLDSNDLDAPGNMYYYIGHREGKFRNHKITFGHPEAAAASKLLTTYFDDFMAITQDASKK